MNHSPSSYWVHLLDPVSFFRSVPVEPAISGGFGDAQCFDDLYYRATFVGRHLPLRDFSDDLDCSIGVSMLCVILRVSIVRPEYTRNLWATIRGPNHEVKLLFIKHEKFGDR